MFVPISSILEFPRFGHFEGIWCHFQIKEILPTSTVRALEIKNTKFPRFLIPWSPVQPLKMTAEP